MSKKGVKIIIDKQVFYDIITLKIIPMQYNILLCMVIKKRGGAYMLFKIDARKLFVACAKLCIGTSDIVKLAKVSTVTLQRIYDNKPVRAKTVGRIAKALGVTPDELLSEEVKQ